MQGILSLPITRLISFCTSAGKTKKRKRKLEKKKSGKFVTAIQCYMEHKRRTPTTYYINKLDGQK
jgi:hypothetical protein